MNGTLRERAQHLVSDLWSLIAPPTVWAFHFLFCYVYAAIRCAKSGPLEVIGDVRIAIAIATVISLLIVMSAGYVAWAQSRIEGDPPPHDESTWEDRVRFLATAKLLISGLSFIAIVYTALPAFMFEDCR